MGGFNPQTPLAYASVNYYSCLIATLEWLSAGGCWYRMIDGVSWFGHITAYMWDVFRWLPVQQRIHHRISSIVWHCLLGNAPVYLLELFIFTLSCFGRRYLRSASRGHFVMPHAHTATRQNRIFSIERPSVWNNLPSFRRSLPRGLSSSFYRLSKTFLFGRAW